MSRKIGRGEGLLEGPSAKRASNTGNMVFFYFQLYLDRGVSEICSTILLVKFLE